MLKLYAYVDESGQETEGRLFLVTTIVVDGNEDEALRLDLEKIERSTEKYGKSWHQTRHDRRIAYVDRALANPSLVGAIFYKVHRGTKAYQDVTRDTIIRALDVRAPERKYKATIFVDGLRRSERHDVAVGLRQAGIPVKKVRGARDQSSSLVRLADAMAGFIRDAEECVTEFAERLRKAKAGGQIREVP